MSALRSVLRLSVDVASLVFFRIAFGVVMLVVYLHFAGLGVSAVAIVVGCCTRTALALFAVGFTWVHLVDEAIYRTTTT